MDTVLPSYRVMKRESPVRIVVYSPIIAAAAFTSMVHAQTRITAIGTQFRWLGPNDKIVVERYDDPKVPNVSCYMSRAETVLSELTPSGG